MIQINKILYIEKYHLPYSGYNIDKFYLCEFKVLKNYLQIYGYRFFVYEGNKIVYEYDPNH